MILLTPRVATAVIVCCLGAACSATPTPDSPAVDSADASAVPSEPRQVRVLKKSELTPAEILYGRAPRPDPSVTYEDNVVLVEGGPDIIRSVSPDWLIWKIDARAGRVNELEVGKIAFVSGRCVGRVLYMQRNGDELTLVLGPVELADIFRTLDITVSQPIDLSEVIDLPVPAFEGVSFPIEGDDAALPDWALEPIPFGQAPTALRFGPAAPGILLRTAAPQQPVSPGIPQSLNLRFRTRELDNAFGMGAEMIHNSKGIQLRAQIQIRAPMPSLDFNLKLIGKKPYGRIILKNATGIRFALDGTTDRDFSTNLRLWAPGPGFSIPLGGSVPFSVDVRHEMWVTTAFSAKASGFSAGAMYGVNGDFGFGFQEDRFMVQGPKGVVIENSLMDNIESISFGPAGLAFSHQAMLTAGLGAWGFTTGPQFDLSTSLSVARGSSIGIAECKGATFQMRMRGGVGWTIPRPIVKFINAILSIFNVKIPDHGGVKSEWRGLIGPVYVRPANAACGMGP